MSIKDVIKSEVYEKIAGGTGFSVWTIATILVAAAVAGAFIYFVYRFSCKSEFYSKDLAVTLPGMSVIVAAIMIAMQSNLIVSLGMVGALSIVRYRTAVKSPMDLLYLFWAISVGIICGVGLYGLGIVLCVGMTVLLFLMQALPANRAPLVLVVRYDASADPDAVVNKVREYSRRVREKSTIVRNGETEQIFELDTKDQRALLAELQKTEGIKSINLLEHHGEMRG